MRSKNEVLCAAAGRLAAERSDILFFLQTFIYRVIQFGIRGPISFLF
jgi:hypothetical protein